MLKIFDKLKKKNKTYDFEYIIYFDNKEKIEGTISNSELPPENIFLNNAFTYFNHGVCTYHNEDKISAIVITNLVEKVEENE